MLQVVLLEDVQIAVRGAQSGHVVEERPAQEGLQTAHVAWELPNKDMNKLHMFRLNIK